VKRCLAVFSLSIALLVGCADTHQIVRAPGATVPLSRQASAYVGVPKDGVYGQTTYFGSGVLTAQAVAAAFAPYSAAVGESGRLHIPSVPTNLALGGPRD
jgi:hypothetical protein